MNIPSKWPGKKQFMVMCSAMRLIDNYQPEHWKMFVGMSGNKLKRIYPAAREHMRAVIINTGTRGKRQWLR